MGKWKAVSHCVTDLDPISTTQMIGSQTAPLIFGLCRMSRQKRKKTKASVPANATGCGKPIRAAIVGRMHRSITIRCYRSDVRSQRTKSGELRTESEEQMGEGGD